MLSVYIFLRSDVDWLSLDESNFMRQELMFPSVRPMPIEVKANLIKAIKIWNQFFSISYFQYRQRLKEIAWGTWMTVRGVDGIIRNRHILESLIHTPSTLVLPVDEDDWFSPTIVESLKISYSENIGLYSWNDSALRPVSMQNRSDQQLPIIRLRNRVREGEYATNGYAICLSSHHNYKPPVKQQLLMHHTMVKNIVEQNGIATHHLPETLSVEHKSLASCTNMKWINHTSDLKRNLNDLKRPISKIPESLQWAEPAFQQVHKLNLHLTESTLA